MKEKDLQSEVNHIRALMDRSTKFIPLSGLSGIMAGIYVFSGAGLIWMLLQQQGISLIGYSTDLFKLTDEVVFQIYLIALGILLLSVATAMWLTLRKIASRGENFRSPGRKELLNRMAVPLISGGLLLNIFLFRGEFYYLAPVSMVFYGLALVAGSHYIISLVKYLGYSQIVLGLLAALFPAYGLICWIAGFGLLHIIYGSILYYKYER